ncbi:type IV toxin-antitoxin system AbiEi family antitoxin domain-containing protein [Corynebacterium terpenotabidum]|uniref:DUF559 domain-containing protein n=1 Tax=Corynebacterium terpenotabidum Y-11 TaxID=1200352 RepID=S4XIN0_9CORY|nr:type IV toxin-antitoxin system AbiEi family antitoxin domain-containing protein [Corynebacterium terpenotabidum]AGP31590.1 hypothetical protein A606_09755 [Corynebacterium terpenotabidum Y-11]
MTKHRLWTTAELLKDGQTHRQIAAATAAGKLHPVIRGVYSVREPTDRMTLRALADQRKVPLTFTGTTAAFLYGLTTMQWPAQGRVPREAGRRGSSLLTVTAGQTLRRWTIDGFRVTSPVETAVCLADGGWDQQQLRNFLTREYSGAKGNDVLVEDLGALPPRLRATAADLLDGLVTGTASKLELRAVTRILRALDNVDVTVQVNVKVAGYRFDIVIPEADVLIEIDSFAFHGAGGEKVTEQTFLRDRWKGNTAVRSGWTLLRYADKCVDFAGSHMAEQVADTVTYNLTHRRTRRRRSPGELLATDGLVWEWHPLFRRA